MANHQTGIFDEVPRAARYLTFELIPGADPKRSLKGLRSAIEGEAHVVGLGPSLVAALGSTVEALHAFPALTGKGIDVPSTQGALWIWLRGDDHGVLVLKSRDLESVLEDAFELVDVVDAFKYREGRDLTGYVDGTENPKGDDAVDAAFIRGAGEGLDGGSLVAVQKWEHNLDAFEDHTQKEQDHMFGRRQADDVELADAPPSAHVKRTAQESFSPEAFVLRRSMPWADDGGEGLVFVAFGKSLDAFEAQLKRMVGHEDGITDALFTFTRPVSGGAYFCPPLREGKLDLRAVGL